MILNLIIKCLDFCRGMWEVEKTIISFIAASNVIRSNYQVVLMAPTEILARQHYKLAQKIFKSSYVKN